MQEWLGLDSIEQKKPPAAEKTTKMAAPDSDDDAGRPSSDDELPESFFQSNVMAVKDKVGPPPGPTPSGRIQRRAAGRGGKPDPARLLESAIETYEEQSDESAETSRLAASDVLQVESDLTDVDNLIQAGAKTFGQLPVRRSTGSAERGPAFSTDEYLRRRRRRELLGRLAVLAVTVFVVVPMAAGVYFASLNQRAVAEARLALARGDFAEASRAAGAAGSFWVGEQSLHGLRRQIELRRALAPVDAARAEGAWTEALEALKPVREEFRQEFAADLAGIEAEISLAMHLDRARRFEEQGDLVEAVQALELARKVAPDPREVEARVGAIRGRLEAELREAEAGEDLEKQIEVYRRFQAVFGGKEREMEARILEYDLKKYLAEGDAAVEARDFEKALGLYYKAGAAAKELRRAEATALVEEKTRVARRLGQFQTYFNRGQDHERKGKLDEALQAYRGALTWIEKEDPGRRTLVQKRIEEVESRKRREVVEGEAGRLMTEAMQALRASKTDAAAAALEALRALKPDDERAKQALAFAQAVTDMVYVPQGECVLGAKPGAPGVEKDEAPERRALLPAYFIDRYETRNRSWLAFVEATGEKRPEHWQTDLGQGRGRGFPPEHQDHPVVNLSFSEAAKFAEWAGKRLPSEDEWEKAARGTDGRTYPWGEETLGVKVNVGAKLSERVTIQTKPVGTSTDDKSPYGAFDMGGNVSEWTAGQEGEKRVLRGGSWRYGMSYARCANRDAAKPGNRFNEVGVRCVKDIPDFLEDLK